MATSKLNIVLDVLYKGKGSLRAANQDLTALDKSAERGSFNWQKYGAALVGVGAAFGGAAYAGKQLYELMGQGAELQAANMRFSNLSESIDSTADAMMGRLKEATHGLMSDAQLVESATQIMSLGLQDTEEGVTRLASVSANLGWDMNQVILTMANDSVMRLDALGLSIDAVREKQETLVATGMEAGKAFDLAVIEAGEEKYKLLGDQVDTTAGKMKIFESSIANAQDAFKLELVESFADGLGDTSIEAAAAAKNIETFTGAVGRLFGALAGGTIGKIGEAINYYDIESAGISAGVVSREDIERARQTMGQDDFDQFYLNIASKTKVAAQVTDSWAREQTNLLNYLSQSNPEMEKYAARINTTANAADGMATSMSNLSEQERIHATDMQRAEEANALMNLRMMDTSSIAEGVTTTFAGGMGLPGIITLGEQAVGAFDALNAELDRLNGRTVEANISLKQSYFNAGGDFSNDQQNPYGEAIEEIIESRHEQ